MYIMCRVKGANILTASNELSSSLNVGEDGLEEVEAIQRELSMSKSHSVARNSACTCCYFSGCKLGIRML